MGRLKQTEEELNKKFEDQLELLSTLCDSYDSGETIVYKSIATSARVILDDTQKYPSLLQQLKLESKKICDTSFSPEDNPVPEHTFRVGSFSGLIAMAVGTEQTFVPYLDETPPNVTKYVDFKDYWNKVIFIDKNNNNFTRKDIVLAIANQDGGAHVGSHIDEKYKNLAYKNALGWIVSKDGVKWNDAQGAERAAIRQIGHEILRTFLQNYPQKKFPIPGNGLIVAGAGMWVETSPEKSPPIAKVGRNDKCPCKSGLKYKKCHGKQY